MFAGLGMLPGSTFSEGTAISADGSTVVGVSGTPNGYEAVRWKDGLIQSIGDLPGQSIAGQALGVSGDGSVITGIGTSANGNEAFRWEDETLIGLGDVPGGSFSSFGWDISGDGSIIVGNGEDASGRVAVRWSGGSLSIIGPSGSRALGANHDGSTIVGDANGIAVVWSNTVMSSLPSLPGKDYGRAVAVSADGTMIVGRSSSDGVPSHAVRWHNGLPLDLGTLGAGGSQAQGLSDDGSIVIGATNMPGESVAFIWTEEAGIQDFQLFLINLGLDLSGWTLTEALGISADGFKIVGTGTNPDGQREAWIAVIPEPSTAPLVITGLLALAASRRGGAVQSFRMDREDSAGG
jgi:probable HAF family extracellular repeat protein